MKLPKQWAYWCKKMNLRFHAHDKRASYAVNVLKGRGRFWRVNCHFNFDMSETYDTFDRFANSTSMTMSLKNINTFEEFKALIEEMETWQEIDWPDAC